ncbi:MAG: sigma-70 family RNA polymerase sigma factor [Chloroflexota bacterium]
MPRVSLDDETALMGRIRQRDEAALRQLYTQCSGPIYSLALRVLGNKQLAEEVMQDVFLKVWNAPDKWDPARGALMSWLLTMTRYAAIDRLRREDRHQMISLDAQDAPEPGVAHNHVDSLALQKSLADLPAEQRQVIEMAYFQGMTHTDIANTTQQPLGTVKTRLRLGMEKLRNAWHEAGQHAPEDL